MQHHAGKNICKGAALRTVHFYVQYVGLNVGLYLAFKNKSKNSSQVTLAVARSTYFAMSRESHVNFEGCKMRDS